MRLVACPWLAVLSCVFLAASTGCTSLTSMTSSKNAKKKESSWSLFSKKEYQAPQSMNVTWTYDIFTKEGKPPTRGFGGRIYFYNERSQAIPVEGELTVYGFDDTLRSHDGTNIESADKKFRFTAEQFTTHFSESQLGASYSIWIPWDAAPGMQKKIMLIPTFKTKNGPVIRGNAATVLLPGMNTPVLEQPVIQVSGQDGVQRASYINPPTNQSTATRDDSAHRTMTLQLPPRGYQAKPVLTPERTAELLQKFENAAAPGTNQVPLLQAPAATPIPSNPTMDNGAMNISHQTVPASQAASSMPSFHIPAGQIAGSGSTPLLFQANGSANDSHATVAGPPTRYEQSPPQAPIAPAVPSSAYRPR